MKSSTHFADTTDTTKSTKAIIKEDKILIKKNRKLLIRFSILTLILAIIVAGSFGVSKAYRGKILPNVTIAGIKVGGKTPEQAKILVETYASQLRNQGPVINYNKQTFNPTLADLGVTFDIDQVVDEAYNYGRTDNWQARIKQNSRLIYKSRDITLDPTINEKTLDTYLSTIANVVEKESQNATLTIKSGEISLIEPQEGLGLNKNKLKNDLTIYINSRTNNNIDLETSVLQPAINNNGTMDAKQKAEQIMAVAPIVFTFEDQSFTADRSEIGSWIEFKEDGTILKADISNEKVVGYVNFIASKIAIKKIDREVVDGTGEVRNEGQDGRGVDTKTLANQIVETINNNQNNAQLAIATYPIPKDEKIYYPSAQPGRFPGRYIDVNLSEQIMRLFDGQTKIAEYQVSTGKWSTPTPIGTRYIDGKSDRAWSAKYGLYLPYWNSLGGGYGIHELPEWPNGAKEGENHLGIPVSHGCIRLGVGPAEYVYNWASIGTPVYIHK